MKSLDELSANREEMWQRLEVEISRSSETISLRTEVGRRTAEATLLEYQLPAGTALGSVCLNTGGVLFADHKMRLLGSPPENRNLRSLKHWNDLQGTGVKSGLLLVGDDILGNFFAVNLGKLSAIENEIGAIFALCPRFFEWVLVADNYSVFFSDLLGGFWQELITNMGMSDVELPANAGNDLSITATHYPPLFTLEGSATKSDVRFVSVAEAFKVASELREALF